VLAGNAVAALRRWAAFPRFIQQVNPEAAPHVVASRMSPNSDI